MIKRSNLENQKPEPFVIDLIRVVEKEVDAFGSLIEVLLQQGLLVPGQEKTDPIFMGRDTERARTIINVQLVPIVKQQYVECLRQLKDVLDSVSDKLECVNNRNLSRLENILKRITSCLFILENGHILDNIGEMGKDHRTTTSYRGVA